MSAKTNQEYRIKPNCRQKLNKTKNPHQAITMITQQKVQASFSQRCDEEIYGRHITR